MTSFEFGVREEHTMRAMARVKFSNARFTVSKIEVLVEHFEETITTEHYNVYGLKEEEVSYIRRIWPLAEISFR